MLYKELYKESNELAKERFALVRERVAEIEEKPETEEKYKEYFRQTAQLLQKQTAVYDPVSYTHLDVYKRQVKNSSEALPPSSKAGARFSANFARNRDKRVSSFGLSEHN